LRGPEINNNISNIEVSFNLH